MLVYFLPTKPQLLFIRLIQNIMQRKPTPENNYHMIIRLIDDRPVLIIPKSPQREQAAFQKPISADSSTTHKQILREVFQTKTHQTTSQPFYTHRKTCSCQINSFNPSNKVSQIQETKYGELKKTKDSLGADKTKISMISQLCTINLGFQTLTIRSEHFNGLESIQCIQSTSIHEGDSYDFEEADSEVISLTNEEKLFFRNFIEPQIKQNKQIQELFKRLSLQSIEIIPQKVSEAKTLPSNKLKVIRNFFKPKEAIVREQTKSPIQQLPKEQETQTRQTNIKTDPLNQAIKKL